MELTVGRSGKGASSFVWIDDQLYYALQRLMPASRPTNPLNFGSRGIFGQALVAIMGGYGVVPVAFA